MCSFASLACTLSVTPNSTKFMAWCFPTKVSVWLSCSMRVSTCVSSNKIIWWQLQRHQFSLFGTDCQHKRPVNRGHRKSVLLLRRFRSLTYQLLVLQFDTASYWCDWYSIFMQSVYNIFMAYLLRYLNKRDQKLQKIHCTYHLTQVSAISQHQATTYRPLKL